MQLSNEPTARKHQLRIARQTLKMNPAMVGVMGGMSIAEAHDILMQARKNSAHKPENRPYGGTYGTFRDRD